MLMVCVKLQALVYDILPWRKVPESDARSVCVCVHAHACVCAWVDACVCVRGGERGEGGGGASCCVMVTDTIN